jgi:hypothetical protein
MYIVKVLSYLGAWNSFKENYPAHYEELVKVIETVQPEYSKPSVEKSLAGKMLVSPLELSRQFRMLLSENGWNEQRIRVGGQASLGYSSIDAVKAKLAVDYQFGKYAFVESDIFVKFPIFIRAGMVDFGIIIMSTKSLAFKMSSGVSNFEMIENRFVQISDQLPNYPFVIIGISDESSELQIHELTQSSDTSNRSLKVFLCHSSGDKPVVRELYQRLVAKKNVDPWLDEIKLLPGVDWNSEIIQAVKESDVVIVCLSRASINKEGYVQKEIRRALDVAEEKPENAIFIIPLRVQDYQVPQRLSQWQWVDYYQDGAFDRLMSSLQKRAQSLGIQVE